MKPVSRKKRCLPCEGLQGPLNIVGVRTLLKHLPFWMLSLDGKKISREFICKDFKGAVAFVKRIAAAAEKNNHHPDLHLTRYRRLQVELTTHAVGGLSENDFILAAFIDVAWEKAAQRQEG